MSRIDQIFQRVRGEKTRALIPFITAGDPDLETTKKLVKAMADSGADIIELGVPFSDPLADGPTIQKSSLRALEGGTTLKKIINLVAWIREEVSLPIVLMSSYNPVFVYGGEEFCKDAKEAGVDGVILPDLPPEESDEFEARAEAWGIDTIFLLAPTSSGRRIKLISGRGKGFLYYVSITGVTGALTPTIGDVREKITEIRKVTDKPLCVGFGISTPDQAREIASFTDGVIVGSAIVRLVERLGRGDGLLIEVGAFVQSLKSAISGIE